MSARSVFASSIWRVVCTNNAAVDTPNLQQAIHDASVHAGTVSIAAGTCALSDNLPVKAAVTITGAGANATFVVQHSYQDIFGVSGDGVTIENISLDTATYDTTAPDSLNPNPPVIYSSGSNTTVRDVTGKAGSGFGMRILGPQPCYARANGGAVVSNVNITNTGTGGYAAVDVSCQNQASLSGITIHGGILAVYRDSNTTINGESFTPGPYAIHCAPPWVVTSDTLAPSQNISISNVTSSGGQGTVRGTVLGLLVSLQTVLGTGC